MKRGPRLAQGEREGVMSKLVLSEDLEVQNFAEIPDRQLVKDIRVIDTYFGFTGRLGVLSGNLGDVGRVNHTKWVEETPFREILRLAGVFNPSAPHPWLPGGLSFTEEHRCALMAQTQSVVDDFCAIVVMEQENASQILLDALSNPDISFGNLRSQWKQELRDRAATFTLLG